MITSHANPAVKNIRSLRDKKARAETGLYLVEGLRIVAEALEKRGRVQTLIYAPQLLISDFGKQLVSDEISRGVDMMEVSGDVFKSLSGKDGPQGLAAVVRQEWTRLEQVELKPGDLWTALDSVADPGNLGTILRTMDAVGGKGVFLLGNCTDPYDPSAIRGSMGAVFNCRFVRANFQDFGAWVSAGEYRVVGTSDKAETDYQAYSYPDPMVLLMGSERQGLDRQGRDICEEMVRIPMAGRSDSLNLAVATGVVLYEIFNQRRNTGKGAMTKG